MHEIRTIAVDDSVAWASVYQSFFLSCGWLFLVLAHSPDGATMWPLLHYCIAMHPTACRGDSGEGGTYAFELCCLYVAVCLWSQFTVNRRGKRITTCSEHGAAFAMATWLSVCLWRWCIVPKRLSRSLCDLHQVVAHHSSFPIPNMNLTVQGDPLTEGVKWERDM